MGSDESHFNVSVGSDGQSQDSVHKPQPRGEEGCRRIYSYCHCSGWGFNSYTKLNSLSLHDKSNNTKSHGLSFCGTAKIRRDRAMKGKGNVGQGQVKAGRGSAM